MKVLAYSFSFVMLFLLSSCSLLLTDAERQVVGQWKQVTLVSKTYMEFGADHSVANYIQVNIPMGGKALMVARGTWSLENEDLHIQYKGVPEIATEGSAKTIEAAIELIAPELNVEAMEDQEISFRCTGQKNEKLQLDGASWKPASSSEIKEMEEFRRAHSKKTEL